MQAKVIDLWRRIEGSFGAVLLLLATVLITSLVKDQFYKSEREMLIARIGTVRIEERATADSKVNALRKLGLARDVSEAKQSVLLEQLVSQNTVLIGLLKQGSKDRSNQMHQVIAATDKAARTANSIDTKLNAATLPKALVSPHWGTGK